MKRLNMAFSARELDELAYFYREAMVSHKPRPGDPDLHTKVDLLVRLEDAAFSYGTWTEEGILAIPWVVPVIRKALADARELPMAQARIKMLEAELKAAKKLAAKPKSRFPKRKALPMKPAAAAGGDPTGVVRPSVNDPLPAAAVAKADDA